MTGATHGLESIMNFDLIKQHKSALLKSLAITAIALPSTAFANRDFQCGSNNSVCVINDRNMVTGDNVGFFTERGELIATGKVTKMSGSRRSVQLKQVMGQVNENAETYAMLDSPRAVSQEQLKIYKQPSVYAVGGSVGATTLAAGTDAKGMEYSGEMIRRKFLGKVDGFARGSYYSISGPASNIAWKMDPETFYMKSLAAIGGVSYTLFANSDVVLRTEVGGGVAYTSASVGSSSEDAQSPDWGYEIKSGFDPYVRGMAAIGFKFDAFAIEAGVAPAMLAGKSATTIGAGILVNMK
jgi:hypothetical protein